MVTTNQEYLDVVRRKKEKLLGFQKRRKKLLVQRYAKISERRREQALVAFEALCTFLGGRPTEPSPEEGGSSKTVSEGPSVPGSDPIHERASRPRTRSRRTP